jgi:hypothetical protein
VRIRLYWWTNAALVSLLLWGLLALGAKEALGAPATPQSETAWLSKTLKVPMTERAVVVAPPPSWMPASKFLRAGEYNSGTDIITVRREYAAMTPTGLYVRLHERLHRAETIQGCYRDEEAITDALTRDLLPALTKHMLGWAVTGVFHSSYDHDVSDVRWASAKATGQSWRSRDARMWRRALWGASCEGREAMLMEAA